MGEAAAFRRLLTGPFEGLTKLSPRLCRGSFNLVFSAQDIIAMLGKNAAIFLELEGEIGTLEAGKQADMVILDGDPLEDIYDVLHVGMVIQGGRVVVDNR